MKAKKIKQAVCLSLLLLVPITSFAAPPSNDQCSNAAVVPATGPFPYRTGAVDLTEATNAGEPGDSCFGGTPTYSIWYTFNPSVSGRYYFSTCFGDSSTTLTDTQLAIFTGTCGALSELAGACGSDVCESNEAFSVDLTAGTTYYIRAATNGVSAVNNKDVEVMISLLNSSVPSNDTCSGAQALTLNKTVFDQFGGATNDYSLNANACFSSDSSTSTAPGADKIYSFTAPAAGSYSFRVRNKNYRDSIVAYLLSSCPSSPATITTECVAAVNRAGTGDSQGEEESCRAMTAGQTYYFVVDAFASAPNWDSFVVDVSACGTTETENNGTTATANSLAPLTVLHGGIAPGTDVDFFSLGVVPTGSRIFAAVDGGTSIYNDYDMRITTETDTLEYDDGDLTQPFGYWVPILAGVQGTGVPTFIRINQFGGDPDMPYRLFYVVQGASSTAAAEVEPNDTINQASASSSMYYSGTLSGSAPSTDVDYYAFTAKAGAQVFIALDGKPDRTASVYQDSKLTVMDAQGNIYYSVRDVNGDNSTASGAGSLTSTAPRAQAQGIFFNPPSNGRYYLKVSGGGANSATYKAEGAYLLSITGTSADADLDGIADDIDNCPSKANATQADSDADGKGDVCDNCAQNANSDQADSDSDGFGNACESCPTDPAKTAVGVCGCGIADSDANTNQVVDCLTSKDYKGQLDLIISLVKQLKTKKNTDAQKLVRATLSTALTNLKSLIKNSIKNVNLKDKKYKLKEESNLAITLVKAATKAKTDAALKVAKAAANAKLKAIGKKIKTT